MPAPSKRPRQLQLSLADIESVAPARVRRIGGVLRAFPDLLNFFPSRLVPRAEAVANGWVYWYGAQPCHRGHIAPRYVAGHGMRCVDCKHDAEGKPRIGIQLAPAETADANPSGAPAHPYEETES
jgi:hypothetical protein